jgi:hypothetical protein
MFDNGPGDFPAKSAEGSWSGTVHVFRQTLPLGFSADVTARFFGRRYRSVFRQRLPLDDFIGCHAFARSGWSAAMRVINAIHLGWSLLLPVDTVNCAQTLKVVTLFLLTASLTGHRLPVATTLRYRAECCGRQQFPSEACIVGARVLCYYSKCAPQSTPLVTVLAHVRPATHTSRASRMADILIQGRPFPLDHPSHPSTHNVGSGSQRFDYQTCHTSVQSCLIRLRC